MNVTVEMLERWAENYPADVGGPDALRRTPAWQEWYADAMEIELMRRELAPTPPRYHTTEYMWGEP
jgi:hypothetical protein